jgi:DNA-binding response OmpR family regulator
MADVLVVSDRADHVLDLVAGLEAGGHRVGVSSFDETATGEPDVVIVDAVKDIARARDRCRAARTTSTRTRIIAVLSRENVDAIGPDWEADTFLLDGSPVEEALARIRLTLGPQVAETGTTIRVGDLSIDPDTYQVRLRGRPLDLTYKEFQLLQFLAKRPGRVFSRSQLLQEVWGYDFFGGTRTVDVHVRRLRAKLGAEHESMIATVRNVGYKVEPPRSRG